MITKLNLASHPFRNRTLPYLIALLLLAFSVAGAVLSFAKLSEIEKRNEIAKNEIKQMETEVQQLKDKGDLVQKQLSPEQRALLIGAHKLAAQKSFGWSRLFADLERVMPGSVSASRVSVENIFMENNRIKAELDFAVLSRDYQGVMQMIDNMNNSGVFKAELRGQDLQKNERLTYTEFTLHLIYAPEIYLPGNSTGPELVQSEGGNQ